MVYTEALWSTYCTLIKDCDDLGFWILFLAYVFSMAIILVFKTPICKLLFKANILVQKKKLYD